MNELKELERLMIEKAITIRAIPYEVKSYWSLPSYYEKDLKHIKGKIVRNYENKFHHKNYLQEKIDYPKNAGKFIILRNCDNGEMISFRGKKYFDSLEEAIKSVID